MSAVYNALCYGSTAQIKELKLAPLQLIDPSKIHIREHVFLSILYKIKKTVDSHNRENSQYRSDSSNDTNEHFRNQFKQLAGGLQLLNEEHNPLTNIDEEVFLDWGIERAKDGVELAKNFQNLVELTCKILDANALVIAIDDADTNFKKGREILELIRCYLDTSRFVVLFTGDMKLYSHLVRDHYHENMGDRLYRQDPSRNVQREKLIDHLEDQYLLKLFPINKRIQLPPLWIHKSIDNIFLTHSIWGAEPRKLDVVVTRIITDGLRLKSDQDIQLFREFLYKQPLRSILQLLNTCAPYLVSENSSITPTILSEAMRAMVQGSLYKKEVDIDALGAGDTPTLIDAVFRLTLEDGEFDTGAYLRPQPKDESLRKSFAALSTEVARLCENSTANTIKYLLQGPGSVALYKDSRSSMKIDDDETAQGRFKNYLSIGREEDALNWAWHATPVIMNSTTPSTPIRCGVIRLSRSTGSNSNATTIEQILTELELKPDEELPAFAFTLINVFDKDNRTYASIFNTLGLMCRLLRDTNKNPLTHVTDELSKIRPTPTISAPRWSEGTGPEDSLHKEDETEPSYKTESKLFANLAEWITETKRQEKNVNPSAILIGKIWTRLYFSLINVAQNYSTEAHSTTGAATIMEFYALCVINAVFVEEHEHHYSSNRNPDTSNNFRKNPKQSGSTINSKFKDFKKGDYPLTTIIGGCPLILNLLPNIITYTELFSALSASEKNNPGVPERTHAYINLASIPRQARKNKSNNN
ncbi:hypothetical protein ACOI9X_12250 [Pseudomonas sp. P2757]|uniref:hypothetical protein n=1 Tax=unclassified Pseudomonas TaxID=196821 RepID=UPI003B5CD921